LIAVKETKDHQDRQAVMERDSKTKKPDANIDKTILQTIKKHIANYNIPEYIHINKVRVTTNKNWSVSCTYKANTKITIDKDIKCLIYKVTRNIGNHIIDVQDINWWLGIKIYQISLEEYIAFRYDINITQLEIYKASKDPLDILKYIIEAEYSMTYQYARWCNGGYGYGVRERTWGLYTYY
jgi:hypothetical protein